MRDRSSQRDRILQLLQEREDQWVPLYEILPLAAQYGSRVFELRRMGHQIENRVERCNGVVRSWFRLVAPQVQPALFAEEREILVGRP